MSQAPYVLYGARRGFRFGNGAARCRTLLFGSLKDPYAELCTWRRPPSASRSG